MAKLPAPADPLTYFYLFMTGKPNHECSRPHVAFPPSVTVPKSEPGCTKRRQPRLLPDGPRTMEQAAWRTFTAASPDR